jgi:hypothetical protein
MQRCWHVFARERRGSGVVRRTAKKERTLDRRVIILAAAVALGLAACAGTSGDPAATSVPPTTLSTTTEPNADDSAAPAGQGLPSGPSALDDMYAEAYPDPVVDPREIISGGPPPDGIPPIEDPVFVGVSEHRDLLPAVEPVVAVDIGGDARAYPVRVMIWHEIVNDVVGDVPVAVTYCPLCNSAATYDRRVRGVETTFGTSGRLYASALVMYDRATESLWTHYDGRAVVGVLAGERLRELPSPLMSWDDFRSAYPEGRVLDWRDTGFDRSYGSNPYVGYDDPAATPFLFRGALDDRAAALQRVVGIETDEASVAIASSVLMAGSPTVTTVEVGGRDLVVFWKPGQASALDSGTISSGEDVGTAAVFDPVIDGTPLTFTATEEGFVDDQTGSTWSIVGEAMAGEYRGHRLERVPHLDTFWFAWSTYQPGSELVGG